MSVSASFSLSTLLKHSGLLSEVEVAQVAAMLLQSLDKMHAHGRQHGNITLDSVTIRIPGHDAVISVHLEDPDMQSVFPSCHQAAHRPPAGDDAHTAADDIWSVGVLVLQLLMGLQDRRIVDKETGVLPMLPRGTTLEAIDFLMDCLAPDEECRAATTQLLQHSFLRSVLALPKGPAPAVDEEEHLAESLSDVLLITQAAKQQAPRCRPPSVPALEVPGPCVGKDSGKLVCFTMPSHTKRCLSCGNGAAERPHGEQRRAAVARQPPSLSKSLDEPPELIRMASPENTRRSAPTKRRIPHSSSPECRTPERRTPERHTPEYTLQCPTPARKRKCGEVTASHAHVRAHSTKNKST
jgi:serine/threonine protein kinase